MDADSRSEADNSERGLKASRQRKRKVERVALELESGGTRGAAKARLGSRCGQSGVAESRIKLSSEPPLVVVAPP